MNIQSLSICVPAKGCINDCEFCCSKMHGGDYEDRFTPLSTTMSYIEDMKKRLEYARDNGCNTLMLTGNNEPQQNKGFLRVLGIVNKSLKNPFLNIEMQTSGAFIDDEMLDFLKEIGVTTIAISVACLDDDNVNSQLIKTPDKNLNIRSLCKKIKARNMNLRICLNMNDSMVAGLDYKGAALEKILALCKDRGADQLTCRALWTSEDGTSQAKWISEHVTDITHNFIKYFKYTVKSQGTYLDTLEYGADRYDFMGFSTVVDEDSMAKETNKEAIKYLILRPDGHLYSKWDSKASLIF
mgnify:CR=1 FL=1